MVFNEIPFISLKIGRNQIREDKKPAASVNRIVAILSGRGRNAVSQDVCQCKDFCIGFVDISDEVNIFKLLIPYRKSKSAASRLPSFEVDSVM